MKPVAQPDHCATVETADMRSTRNDIANAKSIIGAYGVAWKVLVRRQILAVCKFGKAYLLTSYQWKIKKTDNDNSKWNYLGRLRDSTASQHFLPSFWPPAETAIFQSFGRYQSLWITRAESKKGGNVLEESDRLYQRRLTPSALPAWFRGICRRNGRQRRSDTYNCWDGYTCIQPAIYGIPLRRFKNSNQWQGFGFNPHQADPFCTARIENHKCGKTAQAETNSVSKTSWTLHRCFSPVYQRHGYNLKLLPSDLKCRKERAPLPSVSSAWRPQVQCGNRL